MKGTRFEEEAKDNVKAGRYDLACFSAQQASEMKLKGLLIKLTGTRPYTRILSEIAESIKISGVDIPDEVMICCRELEEHYLQSRYPDASLNEYRKEEAEKAIECMEVIRKFVERVLQETS